ncbi:folate-dependent phosphoribosylglycinamide formyltransferase PurN [Candidatus Scalindua japonica]|uniref:Phosphoribosylglycinamide formyltransferase n=1 Tax=Candidatus Scalindua japonica TaxID=1284222 RepID=A0A286U3U6_9BACT|nr:folate-dependent phosphoribosylglycinamide formyltransferase PurN [Candidatus Scalindua japonica]
MNPNTPGNLPVSQTINLAVLVSGSGTTLQNLIDKIVNNTLNAIIRIVVSSSPDVYGIKRAEQNGIPAAIVHYKDYNQSETFSNKIIEEIEKYPVDLIILAGFLHLFKIPDAYTGKVMNIHPGLIPAFCGKGYYGHHVHKAAIESGVKISGCTVHFVDNEYDRGPIIIQKTVNVHADDTPDTLAQKVFKEECLAYPEAIRLFAEGRLKIEGRKVRVLNQ